jgi:hypothetical protein
MHSLEAEAVVLIKGLQYVDSKEIAAPSTPRKRQRLATGNATPQSQRKKALTTPTHKRYEMAQETVIKQR